MQPPGQETIAGRRSPDLHKQRSATRGRCDGRSECPVSPVAGSRSIALTGCDQDVAAIRSRGLDRVLGDLAGSGYDSCWTSLRASEVGAVHRRERVFILGYLPEAKDMLLAAHTRSQRWE